MIGTIVKEYLKNQRNNLCYLLPSSVFIERPILAQYRFLMKSQWWDYKNLRKLQIEKLKKLLRFVYEYVPFYQRVFTDLGIKPEEINKLDDLSILPIINKTLVNDHYEDFIPRLEIKKTMDTLTSGSSGEVLNIKWAPSFYYIKAAANARFRNWAKVGWNSKNVHIGAPFFNQKEDGLVRRDYKRKNWSVDTSTLDGPSLDAIVNEINRIKPDYISGYPSILYTLSKHVVQGGKKLSHFPKSVTTTSEIVFDEMREAIESSFHAKLFDWYGCIEGCASAAQCEFGNYHINMEYCLVEFVEQKGLTKIVGTNLQNFAFPLIRYDTGDCGENIDLSCPCNRGLGVMKLKGGRDKNIIKTKNSQKYIYPNYFAKILKSPIKDFQIIQNTLEEIDLHIVKTERFTNEDLMKIKSDFGKYLGNDVALDVNFVDHIARGPSGKHQMVISNL